jgi:hypothetical protein
MPFVRGDNDIVASSDGTFRHCDVDDVVMARSACQLAHPASLISAHRVYVAARQEASQAGLARTTPPRFSQYWRRDARHHLFSQEPDMQCPHPAIVPLGCNERPRVVRDARHHADRFDFERPSSSRARAKPSASSLSDKGPCSASQAATPRRPVSRRKRCDAVSVIHALNVVPEAAAAASIARANSGGNDTDRFSRCAMRSW